MNARQFDADTHVLVFETGDDVMSELAGYASSRAIDGGSLTAIGGFRSATIAYFDVETRRYVDIPVDEQCEVVSMTGDLGTKEDGKPMVHVHVVLGFRDGSVRGGHLVRAAVRPTLEVVLTDTHGALPRRFDAASGLPLIDLSATAAGSAR